VTLPLHTAGSLAALAELGLLPLLKNANVASQEEIFHDVQQKLHADLAKTIRHASGGLPDARNVSDVDVALHTRTPRDLLAQFPKGTTVSHDVHRSMYAIPGYTRPVNVYATSDPALAQRGQRHRDTELTLASQFPQLETQARALKQQGLSTEKAWATILELPGDPYEAMLDKATVLQRAAAMAKHAAAFAPGIPQSKPIARLPTITPKTLNRWVMAVQEHEAERAGKHYDLRLVDPDSGKAHSWAIPKAKLPVPGEQLLAIQTFTHTPEYALHFGEKKPQTIGQGYGKGRVWMALKEPTDIIESSNDHVRFNVYQGKDINEYLLHRTHDNKWLIRNTTVTKDTADVPQSRPKYKETTPDKVDVSDPSHLMMAKIDGAHNTFRLDAGGPVRIFSYRPTERNTGIIEHTHRFVPGLTARVPSHLDGLVLRGELFAADPHTGRAREAVETGAVLNSGVWKSRDTQQHSPLRAIVFDVARRKGQNVESLPYQEKLDILKKVHAALPFLELPPMANTTKEKVTLLNRIRTGQEPTTREGVVLWPLKGGAPIKAKFKPDHDVYVREIFPEQGARGEMAGGFAYSWSPTGKIVGRVGTGFDFTLKKDMLENPEKYIGRVARVEAQSVYRDKTSPKKPGALRAPAFKDWHLDKGMQPLDLKTAALRPLLGGVLGAGLGAGIGALTSGPKHRFEAMGIGAGTGASLGAGIPALKKPIGKGLGRIFQALTKNEFLQAEAKNLAQTGSLSQEAGASAGAGKAPYRARVTARETARVLRARLRRIGIDPQKARIAVAGAGGTGKSTLAREVAKELKLVHRDLDWEVSKPTHLFGLSRAQRKMVIPEGTVAEQIHIINNKNPDEFDAIIRVHRRPKVVEQQILQRGRGAAQMAFMDYPRLHKAIEVGFQKTRGRLTHTGPGVELKVRPPQGFQADRKLDQELHQLGINPEGLKRHQKILSITTGKRTRGLGGGNLAYMHPHARRPIP